MFHIFKKKVLSKELKLDQLLSDIQNILYSNTNAASIQMRGFVECLCKAVLTYEGVECMDNMKLVRLIKLIEERQFFSRETILLLERYRQLGNDAAHNLYYPTKQEIAIDYSQLVHLYEDFKVKYESEYHDYRKELLQSYQREFESQQIQEKMGHTLLNGEQVHLSKEEQVEFSWDNYSEIQKLLMEQIEQLEHIFKEIGIEDPNIAITKEKLAGNTFNVVVLGEVNRGKSTLINALLGNNILPSNILPTTSVITKVVHGETAAADVEFYDGSRKKVVLDKLIDYVTTIQQENNTKIKSTTVSYPDMFGKDHCVLVDTPGVNDIDHSNTEITYNYIPYADAVIFLIDPDQVFTQSEKIFIKTRILQHNHAKMFFVLNKADNINEDGIKNLKKYIRKCLTELNLPDHFYVVSAKKALLAKMKNESNHYRNDFAIFEKELEEFLFEEKGKQALLNGCGRINSIAEDGIHKIKELYQYCKCETEELRKKEAALEVLAESIRKEQSSIFQKIDKDYESLQNKITDIINQEMNLSLDRLIDQIISQDTINQDQLNELEGFINKSINEWINQRISPILTNEFGRINYELIQVMREKILGDIQSNEKDESQQETFVVMTFEDMQSQYSVNPKTDTNLTFVGVGAVLTGFLSGSILGGAIVAALLYYITGESKGSSRPSGAITPQMIANNITKKREMIIDDIKSKFMKKIYDDYSNNKKYVTKQIQMQLTQNADQLKKMREQSEHSSMNQKNYEQELNLFLGRLIRISQRTRILLEDQKN